ncbi:KEOPS complex subunit Cgi121 [Thermococcus sp. ES12]|uniref:KEOPS complex subunit Cgi121 n=1 Tax=Thermococcus sp. ES12 TaxID=1638246 RepID=UPI001431820D|nr:KEOPS complex subunit Cgi121 [Thermococcus sp. ES12]NJE76251.1 KEOPS complex subunit Cgi121 [Thermococcus sp. ES12]
MRAITEKLHITKVHVESVEEIIPKLGGDVQIVSAECWEAVAFAALLALRSFERKTNHARTLGGELLIRLAGTLQIKDAIAQNGMKRGENYLVVFGTRERALKILQEFGLRELPLTECNREKVKTFFEKAALVEVL